MNSQFHYIFQDTRTIDIDVNVFSEKSVKFYSGFRILSYDYRFFYILRLDI